jgi:predicted ATPase
MINDNLYVVTGGPGAGKTTVLKELESLGFHHAPEVARQIIQEQVRSGGRALPWDDKHQYTSLMLQESIKSYQDHTPAAEPLFSDRGIPDTLCYARLIGLLDQQNILHACMEYRYADPVFAAPPWEEIYATDSERKQDFTEAKRTYELLIATYHEYGYGIVELPKISPTARAQYIVECLPRRPA